MGGQVMLVFREATTTEATPTEAPQTEVIRGGDSVTHIDTLLATYQEDQGNPYVAQYLDVKDVWDKTENLKGEVNLIEDYLRDQVKKGDLDNTTKAADKYLKILAYIEFQRVVNG
jgi:hypothetical protein